MPYARHLIVLAGLVASPHAALADLANGPDPYAAGFGFDTPTEAGWGWNRGDAGSLYAEWDRFVDASHGSATDRTAAPDVGSFGTATAYLGWNAGTFAAGSGNLYSFSVPEKFQVNLSGTLGSEPIRIVLQTEEWGVPIDTSSVRLNGIAPTSSSVTFTDPAYNSSFGVVTLSQRLFFWDLPSAAASYQIDFGSAEHSMSLAQVAIDIGAAPVPLPTAVWLFGSALAGVGVIGRRKHADSSVA